MIQLVIVKKQNNKTKNKTGGNKNMNERKMQYLKSDVAILTGNTVEYIGDTFKITEDESIEYYYQAGVALTADNLEISMEEMKKIINEQYEEYCETIVESVGNVMKVAIIKKESNLYTYLMAKYGNEETYMKEVRSFYDNGKEIIMAVGVGADWYNLTILGN